MVANNVRFSNCKKAELAVLNGNPYEATLALEHLAQRKRMPHVDFLIRAYYRRTRCIDRVEVIEMLGKEESSQAIEVLRKIVQTSSVPLVRYYALRNLIECGIALSEFKPKRTYSSFWSSLMSYEEYSYDRISLDELRRRAMPHAELNDLNWYWLAHC